MTKLAFPFFCLLAVFPTSIAVGQSSPPLVTDRPDFTESGITVPVGSVQIESGVTLTQADSRTAASGTELLLRWSPVTRFEVRLGAPDYTASKRSVAISDPTIGFKYQIGPFGDWDTAVIVVSSIPLGTEISGLDTPEPFLIVTAGREFGDVSFGSQIGGSFESASEKVLASATAVVGTALSSSLGAFVELAAHQQPAGEAALVVHGGFTFEPAPLVQLDFHAGFGLTDTSPDVLVGVGLSLRR